MLRRIGAKFLVLAMLLLCANFAFAQEPRVLKFIGKELKAGTDTFFTIQFEDDKPIKKISVLLDSNSDDLVFSLECLAEECTNEEVQEDKDSLYILKPPKGDFRIDLKNEGRKKAWYEITVKIEY